MFVPGINTQTHRLFGLAGRNRELNGERRAPYHNSFLLFKQKARLPENKASAAFRVCSKQILSSFVSSVFRPVVILRQCWRGFQADSTAPTSQSF